MTPPLRKLPECDRCLFHSRSNYLVCAIHPEGLSSDRCFDFRLDPKLQEEFWAPKGYTWYGGERIGSFERLTESDRLQLLETHPLFTRKCPQCDREYEETPQVHWDCPRCGWLDDSV